MLFPIAISAVLSLPLSSTWTVPQEARMLRLKRGSLMAQIWRESDRLDIDSGYINMTMGQHTIVYFPFGNGDELLFWTWGSSEKPHRLTYWKRSGANLDRVSQQQIAQKSDDLPKWVVNGGDGAPPDVPSAMLAFVKSMKPCAEYSYSPGAGELGCGLLLPNGKEASGVEADLRSTGGPLQGDWCDANGGPPMLKQELAYLKSRRLSK